MVTSLLSIPAPIYIKGGNSVVKHGSQHWFEHLQKIDRMVQKHIFMHLPVKMPSVLAGLIFEYATKQNFYDYDRDFAVDLTPLLASKKFCFFEYRLSIGTHITVFSMDRTVKAPSFVVEALFPKETVVELCGIQKEKGQETSRSIVKTTWGECKKRRELSADDAGDEQGLIMGRAFLE